MSRRLRAVGDRGNHGPAAVVDLSREEALVVLVGANGADLVRLALALTGNREAAESAVRDAYVSLYRDPDALRDRSADLALVRRTVVNGCRAVDQGQPRGPRVIEQPATGPIAEREALDHDAEQRLWAALGHLPPRQREVLVCRHYLDLTEQQSADLLQVSVRSVKEQTSRALAMDVAGTLGPESVRQLVADLVVTEGDVDGLQLGVRERIDAGARGGPAGRSRRRWALAAAVATAAAVAGGLALSADDPAPTRPAPTPVSDQPLVPADLVGLWRNVPQSPWLWEFTADGLMGATETSSGYLSGGTVAKTISRRDGDRYITSDPTEDCSTDYRVRLTSAGAVVTVLSGTCAEDWVGAEYDLERLSPGVAGPGAILPRHAKADDPTRMTTAQLDGTWFDPESSTLLVIGQGYSGASLTYVMDDDGDGATDPDQRGLLAMEPDGSIRARPSAGNADVGCGPQFTNVMTDSATMTTTGADGGCAPRGSQQTWIRVN